jgi:hypothetical protein
MKSRYGCGNGTGTLLSKLSRQCQSRRPVVLESIYDLARAVQVVIVTGTRGAGSRRRPPGTDRPLGWGQRNHGQGFLQFVDREASDIVEPGVSVLPLRAVVLRRRRQTRADRGSSDTTAAGARARSASTEHVVTGAGAAGARRQRQTIGRWRRNHGHGCFLRFDS